MPNSLEIRTSAACSLGSSAWSACASEMRNNKSVCRSWRFRVVSHEGTSFARDMGYYTDGGEFAGFQPGVSVFRKDGDRILRLSDTSFGPNDDFCGVWHLYNLFPEGADGWSPKYKYS